MFSKLGKDYIESILSLEEVKRLVDKALSFQLKEEIVSLLEMIKSL